MQYAILGFMQDAISRFTQDTISGFTQDAILRFMHDDDNISKMLDAVKNVTYITQYMRNAKCIM